MKAKPTGKNGGVVLELGPKEQQLPERPPFQIRNILVPIDFSDCATKALQYAVPFAKEFSAALHLLHVQELPLTGIDSGYVEYETKAECIEQMQEMTAKLAPDLAATTEVTTGSPFDEIVRSAREHKADLIIISTHGRRGLTRMLLGSTTEKVVRYAPCPVLVVREAERDFILAGSKWEREDNKQEDVCQQKR